jgi:hypothetical protein
VPLICGCGSSRWRAWLGTGGDRTAWRARAWGSCSRAVGWSVACLLGSWWDDHETRLPARIHVRLRRTHRPVEAVVTVVAGVQSVDGPSLRFEHLFAILGYHAVGCLGCTATRSRRRTVKKSHER